jgi:hypothetical protein
MWLLTLWQLSELKLLVRGPDTALSDSTLSGTVIQDSLAIVQRHLNLSHQLNTSMWLLILSISAAIFTVALMAIEHLKAPVKPSLRDSIRGHR